MVWVILYFFTICMYKHCFLPLLLVFVMKCVKMHCFLPHNPYCCSLPSPVCLLYLPICTCINSSPITCPPSSVLCWCLLCFLFYFCCISLCSFSLCMCFLLAFITCDVCVDVCFWVLLHVSVWAWDSLFVLETSPFCMSGVLLFSGIS